MKFVRCRIGLGHDLNRESPARIVALFNALIQVSLMSLPALADGSLCLCVGQVFDPLLGFEMELNPEALVLGVDKTEGVAAEPVHMAVGGRDSSVAHHDGHLVERLRE